MDKLTLDKKLNQYNNTYRTSKIQLISDQEYDALVDQYELLYGTYVPLCETHYECQLPFYSPSLSKFKLKNKLLQWQDKQIGPFVVMDKLDGMSIIIHYHDDKIDMYTHGDGGYKGSCISHLLPYINIPKKICDKLVINEPININNIVIRGELYIKKSNFNKYKNDYVSERNCIAGIVNNKKCVNNTLLSDFTFTAFEIQNSKMCCLQQLQILTLLGFNIPNYTIVNELDFDFLTNMLKTYCDNPRDGLVIASSNIENVTEGLPLHKIAFKILGDTAIVTVKFVEWNESKYCRLKPRIHYTSVFLDQGNLEWCSGFHAQFIKDYNIGPGTQLLMTRSGGINPYIVDVVESTKSSFPDIQYIWKGCDIYIDINDQVKIKRIYTFFDVLKTKFLGLKTIEKLYNYGLINLNLIYHVTLQQLLKIPTIKEASAAKILNAIRLSLTNVTLTKVMVGSCLFPGFGETKIQQILNYTPQLYDIIINKYHNNLTIDNLQLVPGIKEMAEQFLDRLDEFIIFLNDLTIVKQLIIDNQLKNNIVINDLTTLTNDKLSLINDIKEDLPLKGMVILFSGDKKLTEKVKLMGAIVEQNYKKNVTLLVVNEVGTMNNKEARALKDGKTIMSLQDFKIKYNID